MKSARQRPLYLDPNLQLIFGVTLSAVMGVSSITPVFPAMARELDIPVHSVGLLITVFTLPGIFLAPVLGVLADLWGRKRILVPL
jgi:MFS family permease